MRTIVLIHSCGRFENFIFRFFFCLFCRTISMSSSTQKCTMTISIGRQFVVLAHWISQSPLHRNNNNPANENCWIVCFRNPQLNWLRSTEIKIIMILLLFMDAVTFVLSHTNATRSQPAQDPKMISRSQKSHQSTVSRVRVTDATMSDDKHTDFYRQYAIAVVHRAHSQLTACAARDYH